VSRSNQAGRRPARIRAQSARPSGGSALTAVDLSDQCGLVGAREQLLDVPRVPWAGRVQLEKDQIERAGHADHHVFDHRVLRAFGHGPLPGALADGDIERVLARRREPDDTGERIRGVSLPDVGLDAGGRP